MTIAISTSSPMVGAALIDQECNVLREAVREAKGAASGAVAALIADIMRSAGVTWADIECIAVDVGPGAFTGVRVGVTMAKTFAWARKLRLVTANSFDLISPDQAVVVPYKKSEWYMRQPGESPVVVRDEVPAGCIGYGHGVTDPVYPSAARFAELLETAESSDPYRLTPLYIAEPSISLPRDPRVTRGLG